MKFNLVVPSIIFADSMHVKACANSKKMWKRIATQQALWYEDELKKEINNDRKSHGKKPLKDDNDKILPTSGGGPDDFTGNVKTQKCSTTDPESSWFRKGEHKHVFAYALETACDKHGWILGFSVHSGNEHDSRTFKAYYNACLGRIHGRSGRYSLYNW